MGRYNVLLEEHPQRSLQPPRARGTLSAGLNHQSTQPSSGQPTSTHQETAASLQNPPTPFNAELGKEGSREVGKEGSRERGFPPSSPSEQVNAPLFDPSSKPYRKDRFLFTDQEFYALDQLKLDLRAKFDLQVTKTDIARCGIGTLIDDYKRHGATSIVVRTLRLKGRK